MISGMPAARRRASRTGVCTIRPPVQHAPFVGGITTVLLVFLVAGFSFQGTEAVGLAAAETRDPGHSVPTAIRSVFWRILLFYIGSILVVGTLIPFTDPNLLRGEESSRLFAVHHRVPADSALRLLRGQHDEFRHPVLGAVLRQFLAVCGFAHAVCNGPRGQGAGTVRTHEPTWRAGCRSLGHRPRRGLAFLANAIGGQKIYQILYNCSGLTGFIIWLGIAISHLRFRRAWVAQGRRLEDLKFRSRFYPYGPWIALMLFVVVIFGANIGVFQTPVFSWFDFITGYAIVPVFLLLYLGHKYLKKTRVVPLQDCNFEPD